MLGDTAIAVHPEDERYRHLIGRFCLLPLMNRPIPIIADPILVKREFGTGCVKVTPGHDPNDYAFAQRHAVPMINLLTPDGRINENGGSYAGLDRYEARKKVVADLEALGLMEKVEPYETEIGHSDRSKTPIEPMLSEQWFLKMDQLAELAMEAVRDGRVQFFPARYAKTYLDWLSEKRDWCISRQLWWGHRIPIWHLKRQPGGHPVSRDSGQGVESLASNPDVVTLYVSEAGRRQMPLPEALEALGRDPDGEAIQVCLRRPEDAALVGRLEALGFQRDPDVLDTWFSSALWPFSTLGWPHDGEAARPEGTEAGGEPSGSEGSVPSCSGTLTPARADFEYFFPTSTLVTGRGIITLWVARMVLSSLYFTKRVPFQHVYIHPIILDGQGRIMSKSLGNGVDPLDIIELYGADALRFTIAQMATETQDVRMPVKPVKLPDGRRVNTSERFEAGRNLCNKLWQAATGFVIPNLAGYRPRPLRKDELAVEDRWIASRLAGCIAEADRRLARYEVSDLADKLRTFFWSDFCDWYLELVKPRLLERDDAGEVHSRTDESAAVARQVLAWILDQILRLFHPIMPFITEALFRQLNQHAPQRGILELRPGEPALIRAAWPGSAAGTGETPSIWQDPEVERQMESLQSVIRALRDILARVNTSRAAAGLPAIGKIPAAVIRTEEVVAAGLRRQQVVLRRLGRCESVQIGSELSKPPQSATQVLSGVEVYVPLSGLMDLEAEGRRLRRQLEETRGHIERLAAKLSNPGFLANAPAAVVEQERARLAQMQERQQALARNLDDLAD